MLLQVLIQEILKSGKYSEQDIAKYVGVSKETIRRIKNGKAKKPTYKTSANIMSLYLSLRYGSKALQGK